MIDKILIPLTFLAALGSGLIAGVFFAFSTFVMRALGRIPVESGIAAMQSINVVVINPIFMFVFLGTAVASAATIVCAFMHWEKAGATYLLAGGVLYLVGTLMVTILFNVPLNDSLASVAPDHPDAAQQWVSYQTRWTTWNHVRAAAALAAAGSFVIALRH